MATSTPSKALRKPDGTDLVSVLTDISVNMDILEKDARGEIGYAELVAPSATLNTVAMTDVAGLVTAAIAIKAGRKIKVTLTVHPLSSVANDRVEVGVYKDNPAANTLIQDGVIQCIAAAELYTLTHVGRFVQAADANVTFNVKARRRAGTGNCSLTAAAGLISTLLVEDIGAA